MHILGFDCYGHDAAAAIVRDGQLLGLVEEERFVRKKHVSDFPEHSIRWCCDIAGIQPCELDHIVFYWDPDHAFWRRVGHVVRYFPRSLELVRSRKGKETSRRALCRLLNERFGIGAPTHVHFPLHHVCHAASAFLTSPYEEAAILSIDAAGEWDCTWMGFGRGLDMRPVKRMQFPNSIGLVYGAVTEYLGFKFASGEGKVMGLAPYGDPDRHIDVFRDIVKTKPGGEYQVDLSYFAYHYRGRPKWFSRKFYDTFGPARGAERELTRHYMDVAAALQRRTEEIGLHMARWLQQETEMNKVCLAGGVCLNSVMNGRILTEGIFDDVLVQPAANDAGTALGACYWLWNTVMRNPRKYVFEHAYVGPDWTDAQIDAAADRTIRPGNGITRCRVHDAPVEAARLLAKGKIVAWFQGRMEMGPRALGNRSILSDPRSAEIKDLLNSRVKFREAFRPFAPSVLEERSGDWFSTDYPSPYMILVYDVLPQKRDRVPAITHVDGTGRVQTVSRRTNPRYHRLISEFEKLTGVPIVLNTSFNVRGEPIVNRPEQAVECFLKTGIDALFLGNLLLAKPSESAAHQLSDQDVATAHAIAAVADNDIP